MNTHNTLFLGQIKTFPKICLNIYFMGYMYWKNFIEAQVRVRISHAKRATRV